jgi:hypothetical protein
MTKHSKASSKKPARLKNILKRDLSVSKKELEKVVGGITVRKAGKGQQEY